MMREGQLKLPLVSAKNLHSPAQSLLQLQQLTQANSNLWFVWSFCALAKSGRYLNNSLFWSFIMSAFCYRRLCGELRLYTPILNTI